MRIKFFQKNHSNLLSNKKELLFLSRSNERINAMKTFVQSFFFFFFYYFANQVEAGMYSLN